MTAVPEQAAADVALLTSELVTNAVRHAHGPPGQEIVVRVSGDERIHIEVFDSGPLFTPPGPRQPFDTAPSGWGLFLLDRLADAWGVEAEANGKKVWFELDVRGD